MEDNTEQENVSDPQIEDLPNTLASDDAENVKGGRARRGGDDDDLKELQVEP